MRRLLVVLSLLLLPALAEAQDLSFRAMTTNSDVTFSLTSLTVTAPTGLANDDLIFIMLATFCINPCTSPTITPASGFTTIRSDIIANLGGGAIDTRFSFYYKIAASEGASWTFTAASAVGYSSTAHAWDNPNLTTPFQTSSFASISASTSFTATSLTLDQTNQLILFGMQGDTAAATATPPSGMTERTDANQQETASVIQAGAGATGSKTGTNSASATGGAWLFSFYSLSSVVPPAGRMTLVGVGP